MFLIKKLVSPFLFPEPILFLLLLVGVICLWRRKAKSHRTGRWVLTATFVLYAIVALRPIPEFALSSIESRYSPMYDTDQVRDVQWIVVLSGGVVDDPAFIKTHQLSARTLIRLVEGIRLAGIHPDAKLILSGGGPFSAVTAASAMAETATMLGVEESRIVLESASRDTEEQAEFISTMVRDESVLLVTSASHMPRSVALFRRQGMEVIPAPTDFMIKKSQRFHPQSLFPAVHYILAARTAVREGLGLAWSKLRGRA